eukprot:gene31250-66451_t
MPAPPLTAPPADSRHTLCRGKRDAGSRRARGARGTRNTSVVVGLRG